MDTRTRSDDRSELLKCCVNLTSKSGRVNKRIYGDSSRASYSVSIYNFTICMRSEIAKLSTIADEMKVLWKPCGIATVIMNVLS